MDGVPQLGIRKSDWQSYINMRIYLELKTVADIAQVLSERM
jgi:hypothetical protein